VSSSRAGPALSGHPVGSSVTCLRWQDACTIQMGRIRALARHAGPHAKPLVRIKRRAKLSVSTTTRQLACARTKIWVGQQAAPGDPLAGSIMSSKTIAAPRTRLPHDDA
jgi:hypothetical protein